MAMRSRSVAQDVRLEEQSPLTSRRLRKPNHPFFVKFVPFVLTPTFIAPVLAGESLKNGLVQLRALSEPIFNKVSGWWIEHYVFYVRAGDLLTADSSFRDMLTGAAAWSPTNAANSPDYHKSTTTINWFRYVLDPIVRAYFREEGEVPSDFAYNANASQFKTKVAGESWTDSFRTATQIGGDPAGADEWAKQWVAYQAMRRAKLTQATFEEYLAEHGVSTPPKLRETDQDLKIPELLRYVREFTYPNQVFNTSTGDVSGAVSWTISDRIDKSRFFAEPGFLVGLLNVRPKVFRKLQLEKLVDQMTTKDHWLPPEYDTDPHASILHGDIAAFVDGATPGTNVYYDIKDLFLFGDQFINVAPGAAAIDQPNWATLPSLDGSNVRYPADADCLAMFSTANKYIVADGVVSLSIASRLQNTTA